MTNEEIKKSLQTCTDGFACEGCPYDDNFGKCVVKLKEDARSLIIEQEQEIEKLKTALKWYMDMYGCRPERNVYDDTVEYSCNGYVTDKEEATALLKAKEMLDWFE